MKATGIVRRIDDLGRVVIPKEIRRTLRIKEGTPLEIFTDREGEIILKKYSPIGELSVFAKEYAESLSQSTGMRRVTMSTVKLAVVPGSKLLRSKRAPLLPTQIKRLPMEYSIPMWLKLTTEAL